MVLLAAGAVSVHEHHIPGLGDPVTGLAAADREPSRSIVRDLHQRGDRVEAPRERPLPEGTHGMLVGHLDDDVNEAPPLPARPRRCVPPGGSRRLPLVQETHDRRHTERIGDADEPLLARAGHLFLTIGQNSGFFLSPNETYDGLVGHQPSRCPKRDLIADLIRALAPRGVAMMVCFTCAAPALDARAFERLKYTPPWDARQIGFHPGLYRAPPAIRRRGQSSAAPRVSGPCRPCYGCAANFWMRWLPVSATYRFPDASTATPRGFANAPSAVPQEPMVSRTSPSTESLCTLPAV